MTYLLIGLVVGIIAVGIYSHIMYKLDIDKKKDTTYLKGL